MSAGKRPYMRYRIINACLKNKFNPFPSKDNILEKLRQHDFNIEERTFYDDIQKMRFDEQLGFLAPIAFCKKNKGYHYTDPNYSIENLPLSDDDIQSLSFALELIQQYNDVELVGQFAAAFEKIMRAVDQYKMKDMEAQRFMDFEKAPYYKGIEHLKTLLQAIRAKQPLRIAYRKFSELLPMEHVFHPYFLKEYKNRWYVLGYSKERHIILTLALDRMEFIQEEPVVFKENTRLKPEEYFQDTLGVTLGKGGPQDVVLLFTPMQGHYIKTQHLHQSQQILQDDEDGLLIKLRVVINYELQEVLMSYGASVQVKEPLSLRETIREKHREAWERG
ncbi:helix-turn-helix transcriptional regulator [Chryseosolibacter indicus]|uniref:WYL domain-containing protein n=1 Tax=Chryseosolibacter indicus TaxID=2782351 RepID=A0ABS5VPY8_9BACT|nr:WYL domain-containing protein [Chryseosolibacter indicus]MBT1702844.1 WYL domain-containing protein [Chryseosolibacter indicus]